MVTMKHSFPGVTLPLIHARSTPDPRPIHARSTPGPRPIHARSTLFVRRSLPLAGEPGLRMGDFKPFHNLSSVLRDQLSTFHSSQDMWRIFDVPGHVNVDPSLYQASEYENILSHSPGSLEGRSVSRQAGIRGAATINRIIKKRAEVAMFAQELDTFGDVISPVVQPYNPKLVQAGLERQLFHRDFAAIWQRPPMSCSLIYAWDGRRLVTVVPYDHESGVVGPARELYLEAGQAILLDARCIHAGGGTDRQHSAFHVYLLERGNALNTTSAGWQNRLTEYQGWPLVSNVEDIDLTEDPLRPTHLQASGLQQGGLDGGGSGASGSHTRGSGNSGSRAAVASRAGASRAGASRGSRASRAGASRGSRGSRGASRGRAHGALVSRSGDEEILNSLADAGEQDSDATVYE